MSRRRSRRAAVDAAIASQLSQMSDIEIAIQMSRHSQMSRQSHESNGPGATPANRVQSHMVAENTKNPEPFEPTKENMGNKTSEECYQKRKSNKISLRNKKPPRKSDTCRVSIDDVDSTDLEFRQTSNPPKKIRSQIKQKLQPHPKKKFGGPRAARHTKLKRHGHEYMSATPSSPSASSSPSSLQTPPAALALEIQPKLSLPISSPLPAPPLLNASLTIKTASEASKVCEKSQQQQKQGGEEGADCHTKGNSKGSSVGVTKNKRKRSGTQWACGVCTFENRAARKICAACGTRRPMHR